MPSESLTEFANRVNGLFVGLLGPDELTLLNECVRLGIAKRSYEGAAGLMGLPKVRVIASLPSNQDAKAER